MNLTASRAMTDIKRWMWHVGTATDMLQATGATGPATFALHAQGQGQASILVTHHLLLSALDH